MRVYPSDSWEAQQCNINPCGFILQYVTDGSNEHSALISLKRTEGETEKCDKTEGKRRKTFWDSTLFCSLLCSFVFVKDINHHVCPEAIA